MKMNEAMNSYIITDSSIVLVVDGTFHTVNNSHANFEAIKEALKEPDWDTAMGLVDVAETINTFGEGTITVAEGVVWYNGKELHTGMTDRILRMIREGFNVDAMLRFLENLMENPSHRSVNELYRFMECNRLPISEDGYFLAYKNVNDNYTDRHTGTFDNSIGSVCEEERYLVEDNKDKTCAKGLHFCSIEYLKGFWGTAGHTMIIKINPKDVVSIPTDYNNSKGRCCYYEVVAEHFDGEADTLSDKAVVNYHNKRDMTGRFTSK
jgi:hypothetical protein